MSETSIYSLRLPKSLKKEVALVAKRDGTSVSLRNIRDAPSRNCTLVAPEVGALAAPRHQGQFDASNVGARAQCAGNFLQRREGRIRCRLGPLGIRQPDVVEGPLNEEVSLAVLLVSIEPQAPIRVFKR